MKEFFSIVLRAVIIAATAGGIGLVVNYFSPNPLALIYEPPIEIRTASIAIPLINEHKAHELYSESAVFLDTRRSEDYGKEHIEGALLLNPDSIEDEFPGIAPLLNEESPIVLYCYGPECDMAEKVADFLGRLGYTKLMIMNTGYRAWEKAGYPIAKAKSKNRSESE